MTRKFFIMGGVGLMLTLAMVAVVAATGSVSPQSAPGAIAETDLKPPEGAGYQYIVFTDTLNTKALLVTGGPFHPYKVKPPTREQILEANQEYLEFISQSLGAEAAAKIEARLVPPEGWVGQEEEAYGAPMGACEISEPEAIQLILQHPWLSVYNGAKNPPVEMSWTGDGWVELGPASSAGTLVWVEEDATITGKIGTLVEGYEL